MMPRWPSITSTLLLCLACVSDGADTIDNFDICIIGGGSSGTYAAVRLQQMGKTVALVERQDRLGGHVDTYTDPESNQALDFGVYILSNTSLVRDFFAHFDTPLVSFSETNSALRAYADFRTGIEYSTIGNEYTSAETTSALQAYAAQLSIHQNFAGAYGWNLTTPIPEDLLLPFGDFVVKYELQAMVDTVFVFLQGAGNILVQPTLYIMRYFDISLTGDFTSGNLVSNAYSDNQGLFDKALAELNSSGSRVFLSSEISDITRNSSGAQIQFTSSDQAHTINATRLLISIPPKLDNLSFLDLSEDEQDVFSKFNNSYYYAAVVRNSGIPSDIGRLTNVDPNAPLNIPAQPSILVVTFTGVNDLRGIYYSSTTAMTAENVASEMIAGIERLEGTLRSNDSIPEIVSFDDHSPFFLTASTEEIRDGFYEKLEALQGTQNTWWTGAAWYKPATADLWNFTEYEVLPRLLG